MCLSISYVLNDTMRARVCARAREKTCVEILTRFFVALRFNRMCISFPFRSIGHTGFTFTHSHGVTYYSPSGSEWKRLSFVPSNMLPPLNAKKKFSLMSIIFKKKLYFCLGSLTYGFRKPLCVMVLSDNKRLGLSTFFIY